MNLLGQCMKTKSLVEVESARCTLKQKEKPYKIGLWKTKCSTNTLTLFTDE